MPTPVRVLIVDDSAFARKVLREILQDSDVEVVGYARDGLEALERIAELKPDVITLDLVMPNLDGIGVLRSLPEQGAPRVVVVSISNSESELGVQALQAGAICVVQKPTALATEQLYELRDELVRRIKEAAAARAFPSRQGVSPLLTLRAEATRRKMVVIGTSTGGPPALTRLLSALPADFPVPLAIALHIPAGYTEELAKRLDRACAIHVVEAAEGLVFTPGMAVIARGGTHLKVLRSGVRLLARLDDEPRDSVHAPSVDVLFETASRALGADVMGVVLTGMGNDGLQGAQMIHEAGGEVLTESEASCVVYGMPRVVKEAGYSRAEASIEDMAATILRHL